MILKNLAFAPVNLTFLAAALCIAWTGCSPDSTSKTNEPQSGNPGESGDANPNDSMPSETPAQRQPVDFDSFVATIDVEHPDARQPVRANMGILLNEAAPGGTAEIVVRARIAEGWHIYALDAGEIGIPMKLALELPDGVETEGEWQLPQPAAHEDSMGPSQIYEGEVVFRRKIHMADSVSAKDLEIKCDFAWQACDASVCLPPARTPLTTTLQGDGAGKKE